MTAGIHFISGLPRSGSTLLSGLLRQNPRFSASIASPVAAFVDALQAPLSGSEFASVMDDARRADMLRGLFDSYYAATRAKLAPDSVVFDTNRTWTARTAMLAQLFPEARIICCVREIGWVIDSVERMLNKNPLRTSRIFGFQRGASVYQRTEALMNGDTGLVGLPWANLREAWFGAYAKRLILVPYEHLAKEPKRTLQKLYAELREPYFKHDFNEVSYEEPEYDEHLGMPGMHTLRKKVSYDERTPSIPPDIFLKYVANQFWDKPEFNTGGVTIL
jgi:sulfotransferase